MDEPEASGCACAHGQPPALPATHACSLPPPRAAAAGSRRRRLWDLPSHAHCPVVGICIPPEALRRLVNRVHRCTADDSDYELHHGTVCACTTRGVMAEAVQKHLDGACAAALRHAARIKDTGELAQWWRAERAGAALAGALWAVLTHARCDEPLEHEVLGDLHMMQHRGALAGRAELARVDVLIDENAVLARSLAQAQQRTQRQAEEFVRRSAAADTELMRTRMQLVEAQTFLAREREARAALQLLACGDEARLDLARESRIQQRNNHDLRRLLASAREVAQEQRVRADAAEASLLALRRGLPATPADAGAAPEPVPLDDLAVLCVGGRSGSVPAYRELVERTGGRFLHHDGGEEDNAARLEATLAAADLVICQTGCISHGAYWRVKDHCKRTAKRCVFVESPSRAALARALQRAMQAAEEPQRAALPGPPGHA